MHGIFFTIGAHAALTPRRVSGMRGRGFWAPEVGVCGSLEVAVVQRGIYASSFFEIDTGWRAARAGRGPRGIGRRRELADRVRGTIALARKLAVGARVVGRGPAAGTGRGW